MKLLFLDRFSKRTQIYIIMILTLAIAAGGTLSLLAATGKFGTKADAIFAPIKASGKLIDSRTGEPISQAKIILQAGANVVSEATTSSDGSYTASASVDVSQPINSIITLSLAKDGYYSGEGNTYSYYAGGNSRGLSINQNLSSSEDPPDYGAACSGENLTRKEISGVVFCAIGSAKSFFTEFAERLQIIADQIAYLKGQTGHDLPKYVLLAEDIYWGTHYDCNVHPRALGDPALGRFSLSRNFFGRTVDDSLYGVTHETGHLIDWAIGSDYKNNVHSNTSASASFLSAFRIASFDEKSVTGYGAINYQEMYAVIFAWLFRKNSSGLLIGREKTTYTVKNLRLGGQAIDPDPFVSGMTQKEIAQFPAGYLANPQYGPTKIRMGANAAGHNALMYLYKYIASQNNLNQYFPGSVYYDNDHAYYEWIWYGSYMEVGVVSFTVDAHTTSTVPKPNRLPNDQITSRMDSTGVKIGGSSSTTRIMKDHGVFSNGEGDLFNTSGTNVILNAQTGSSLIDVGTPGYYAGAIWLGKQETVVPGSNLFPLKFVVHTDQLDVQMSGMPFHPAWCMPNTVIHSNTIDDRNATPVTVGQMKWFPDFGVNPIALSGSITCNQSQGSPVRYFAVGGDLDRWEESGKIQQNAAYGKAINVATPLASSDANPSIDIPVMEQNKSCINDWSKNGSNGTPPAETCTNFKF